MSTNIANITKKSSLMFFGKIFDSFVMFIFNVLAARLMGAKDYGIYVYLSTFIMFGSIAIKLGLDQGLSGILPKYEDEEAKKSVVSFSLLIIVMMSIIVILLSFIFSDFIGQYILNNEGITKHLIKVLPLLVFYAIVQLSEGIFRTIGGIRYYIVSKNIVMPFFIVGTFIIQVFFLDLRGVNVLFRANYMGWITSTSVIIFALIKKQYVVLPKIKFKPIYKQLLLLSIPLIFVGLLDYLIGRVDAFMIGYMIDETHVGIYNVVDKVSYLSSYFFVAFSSIVAPYITKIHHDEDHQTLSHLYKTVTLFIVMINIGITFMVILSSREILEVFGSEYLIAQNVLVVAVTAYLVNALGGPVIYMNSMTGNEKKELHIGAWMLVCNMVMNYILIGRLGILGVALSTLIVFSIGLVARLGLMYKSFGIVPVSRKYVITITMSIGVFLGVYLLKMNRPIGNVLLSIIIYSSIYVVAYAGLIIAFVFKGEERQEMINLMKNRK